MDNARQIAQAGEYDIDQQVAAAAPLEEHSDGRREDGEEDFADIAMRSDRPRQSSVTISKREKKKNGLGSHLAVNAILDDVLSRCSRREYQSKCSRQVVIREEGIMQFVNRLKFVGGKEFKRQQRAGLYLYPSRQGKGT